MVRARRLAAAFAAGILAVALLPGAAHASAPAHAQRRFSAMTYNVYLGAELTPLFGTSGAELVAAAAGVYAAMEQTDFPSRAHAIARQLAAARPDVVGLQEVATWRTAPLSDPASMTTTYDFLALLLDAFAAHGLAYRPVATNVNFAGMLPISATTLASFADRDVILVRTDLPMSEMSVSNPASGTFAAALTLPLGGGTIAVPRGWSTVDVKLRGKTYRFANTHLEAFHPGARAAQAVEMVSVLAPSPYPVVLVGDLNSPPTDSTGAYGVFAAAGFVDAWTEAMGTAPGDTSGQAADLLNVASLLDSRIDYVLHDTDGYVDTVPGAASVAGDEAADKTAAGLWPSDHAGVVATLTIATP